MSHESPQADRINRLLDAVYPSFALLAGMELDLFSILADGALSAEDIATRMNVKVEKLSPLLYALALAGLLTVENDIFANTAESEKYLVRGKANYIGGIAGLVSSNWSKMLDTAKTIRAGKTLAKYDYHEDSEEDLIALFRGLYPGAVRDAERLMVNFDFSSDSSLLDVGGGSGALAISLAKAFPQLKATIMDLAVATAIAKQFVEESAVSEQINIITADAVQDHLEGTYDVIVARHLIQVLSEADSRQLLKNLARICKPGGRIHIIGWMLDNSRLSPVKIVGYNLILLNAYDEGQAYSEKEYHTWLSDAGFEAFERIVFDDGTSILTARMPV